MTDCTCVGCSEKLKAALEERDRAREALGKVRELLSARAKHFAQKWEDADKTFKRGSPEEKLASDNLHSFVNTALPLHFTIKTGLK